MNNKILSAILVLGIASTWFASYSSADDATKTAITNTFKYERVELTDEQKTLKEELKTIKAKKKAGEELTSADEARIEEIKTSLPERKKGHWKRGGKKGIKHLTDDEKTALESMTDDEKKEFFTEKKEEMKAKKESAKAVIQKLINGETLSTEEVAIKVEIAEKMNDSEWRKWHREGTEIIKKLVNWETITDEEKTTLAEMKAKHEARNAAKEAIMPIMEKKKSWEELNKDEQAQLDAFKTEYKKEGKKSHGKKGKNGGKKRGGERWNR